MALGLTQNASTANQFCVPCCTANKGCCTSQFELFDKESVTITFNNFRYFTGSDGSTSENNPWLDFYISPFSGVLKRNDLVNSLHKESFPNTKDFNYYLNNPTDTVDEGYPPNVIIGPYNPGGLFYLVATRSIPVNILVNPKTSIYQNGTTKETTLPVKAYNGYYAAVAIYCDGSTYGVVLSLYRDWTQNDPPVNQIPGLIPTKPMIVGEMIGTSSVLSCSPLFAKGVAETSPFPKGFHWAQDDLTAKFAYYLILYEPQNGTPYYSYNTFAYTPFNWKMDWYITE